YQVVLAAKRRQQAAEPGRRFPLAVQVQVEVPVGEVGRQQIEVVEVGRLDRVVDRPLASDQCLAAALDLGPDPEQEAGGRLGVEIPEQHPVSVAGGQVGDVDRGCRLAHAALDVVRGDNPHEAAFGRALLAGVLLAAVLFAGVLLAGVSVAGASLVNAPTLARPRGLANSANRPANSARAVACLTASVAAISPMASSVSAGAEPAAII